MRAIMQFGRMAPLIFDVLSTVRVKLRNTTCGRGFFA